MMNTEILLETENNSLQNWFGQKIYAVEDNDMDKDSVKYLGVNKQKVLIINSCKTADFLSEKEEMFLLKGAGKKSLLEAINLSLDDVAIINLEKSPIKSFQILRNRIQFDNLIVFGISPKELRMNIEAEKYKVIDINKYKIIFADTLEQIIGSDVLKKQLWFSLQKMFEVVKKS